MCRTAGFNSWFTACNTARGRLSVPEKRCLTQVALCGHRVLITRRVQFDSVAALCYDQLDFE